MDNQSRENRPDPDEVLITVEPANARRVLGVGALVALAAILIRLGFIGDGLLFARLVLIIGGGFLLFAARHIWTSSGRSLKLTPTALYETETGRKLFDVSDVESVERGLQVLRPSNGMVVRTKNPAQRAFAPGLWWRMGRVTAIGGMMNAGQGKAMAEILQMQVARRQDPDDS